jgi:hypothetical protein
MCIKNGCSRLTIDIPTYEKQRLKALSAMKGMSIRKFVSECIYERLHIPNAETLEVFRKAELGEDLLGPYNSVEEMLKDFEADDVDD